jgi:hypothetical protein
LAAVPNRKKKKVAAPVRNACRSLILIDATAIRQKAKKEYEQTLRELEKTRKETDAFHQEDKPRFQQWLNSQFGALLTELREAHQKLEAKRSLLFEIESEVFISNISYPRAYQKVLHRKEREEASDRQRDSASGPNEASGEGDSAQPDDADFKNFFDEGFDEFMDELQDGFAEAFGIPKDEMRPRAANNSQGPVTRPHRIKELYRALVRRLHPDTQSDMTGKKLEWWHQAQRAYEADDADQLEVILTLCEIEEKGTTTQTSVSLLQRITRQFKNSLRSLRSQLAECKRDLAWNFSKRTDLKAFARQIGQALENDLCSLRDQLASIETQFRQWDEQKRQPRRRRSKSSQFPSEPEFLF